MYSVINNLCRRGAKVIYHSLRDLHVSGHAHKEELKLMLSLIRPKFFIPVHGEYRMLCQHADLAVEMGVRKNGVLIPEIGMLVNVNARGMKVIDELPAGNTYIDGDTAGEDKMEMLIRDRKQLAAEGVIIVFVAVRLRDGRLTAPPEVMMGGVAVGDEFVNALKEEIADLVESEHYTDVDKRGVLKSKIARLVRSSARRNMHTYPMVVPVIVEV